MPDAPLHEIARWALGSRTVADAMNSTRAVIGVEKLPVEEADAQAALDKLSRGEPCSDAEWVALELVVRLLRPALFTKRGVPEELPTYAHRDPVLDELWAGRAWRSAVSGVGRIDHLSAHVGTGFLVTEHLVATNRHVCTELTLGTGRFLPGSATISFGEEHDVANAERPVRIVDVEYVHDRLDIALLRIDGPRSNVLDLDDATPDAGTRVVAIGYPGETIPTPLHAHVFGQVYAKRRASPGVIRSVADSALDHDCSTLGGSSGSPVLSLETGGVVGVHFQGRSAYTNRAIPVRHLQQLMQHPGGEQP